MTAIVLQGDARRLPLPDASVDLIVTSPPYFGLRSYTDAGVHYDGQIGSEATPQEWVTALIECTAEWMRVLKPSGSIFVNLGDKYSGAQQQTHGHQSTEASSAYWRRTDPKRTGIPAKSLLGLPWRYALAATDHLGLILRRDIIWAKPNGLPESVTDRCRSSHEYLFHLVKQPRYYAAVDEIREQYAPETKARYAAGYNPRKIDSERIGIGTNLGGDTYGENPLGKLPGSVWSIPSQPLTVPAHLGVDHFAAFPMELPRRCILGWTPPGVCVECGEGRRPVVDRTAGAIRNEFGTSWNAGSLGIKGRVASPRQREIDVTATITGYACACTPYTDHPGTGESAGLNHEGLIASGRASVGSFGPGLGSAYSNRPKVGPWREYHFDGWTPPPTRPAVVADPFGGTGTTALVASMHGRLGFSFDRSADYTRLATWRTHDPAERAKALQVPKPPPIPDGMETLF